jgi:hypothetical protein
MGFQGLEKVHSTQMERLTGTGQIFHPGDTGYAGG